MLGQNWTHLLLPMVILLGMFGIGLIAKQIVFKALRKWAANTQTQADDMIIQAVSGPSLIWIFMLALYVAMQTVALPERVSSLIGKAILFLWIISITVVASRLIVDLIRTYGKELQGALPVTTLTQNLARLTVVIIGLLILLNLLGVSITPILTALGVGGLAVALALQETLSNLFAGLYVSLAGQVRLGDYIKLGSGEEGYVNDISWRSTTIRALPNNLIIIPNSKLAQAIVTNYNLPEKRMALLVPIGVSYESNPEEVERILIDEAVKGASEIPGLLAEPAPFVRFIPGFGDSSLNFTLICQVGEFVDQYLAQHELRKRIFRRFRTEGIEIPFPIRTVYLRNDLKEAPPMTRDSPFQHLADQNEK